VNAFLAVEYAAEEALPDTAALGERLLLPYPSVLQPAAAVIQDFTDAIQED